jgi:hypothetical protein
VNEQVAVPGVKCMLHGYFIAYKVFDRMLTRRIRGNNALVRGQRLIVLSSPNIIDLLFYHFLYFPLKN